MREIVLDTETTGLDPLNGDRIIEIGGVEIINLVPTGKVFHSYFNPEREIPADAVRIHGLTGQFLADKPVFAEVVDDFLRFIADAPLVIHNAPFDMGFLNAELSRLGFEPFPASRVIDTLFMARQKFPGAQNSLDALCKRFDIDTSSRGLHGALLDARLLAEVYLELRGGRQQNLSISVTEETKVYPDAIKTREKRQPRLHKPTEEEIIAHAEFLGAITNPIWNRMSGR